MRVERAGVLKQRESKPSRCVEGGGDGGVGDGGVWAEGRYAHARGEGVGIICAREQYTTDDTRHRARARPTRKEDARLHQQVLVGGCAGATWAQALGGGGHLACCSPQW